MEFTGGPHIFHLRQNFFIEPLFFHPPPKSLSLVSYLETKSRLWECLVCKIRPWSCQTQEDHTSMCWSLLNEPRVTDISKECVSGSYYRLPLCPNTSRPGLITFFSSYEPFQMINHIKMSLVIMRKHLCNVFDGWMRLHWCCHKYIIKVNIILDLYLYYTFITEFILEQKARVTSSKWYFKR